MSQNPKRSNTAVIVVLTLLIVLMIAATAFLIYMSVNLVNKQPEQTTTQSSSLMLPQNTAPAPTPVETEATVPPTTEAPAVEQVIATATIGVQGDLLMHKPVFESCKKDGSYDFSSIFQYS